MNRLARQEYPLPRSHETSTFPSSHCVQHSLQEPVGEIRCAQGTSRSTIRLGCIEPDLALHIFCEQVDSFHRKLVVPMVSSQSLPNTPLATTCFIGPYHVSSNHTLTSMFAHCRMAPIQHAAQRGCRCRKPEKALTRHLQTRPITTNGST